jgi:hypothetical protein
MNEVELKKIWDLLISKYDASGVTYEDFKQKMSSVDGRKRFFNKYTSKGLNLGDYNTYEKKLSSVQSPIPQEKTTPSPKTTDSTPPEEKTVTTNYVTKYPSTQNPKKAFTWKSCDENTYPWTYGCKNTKIGQMNMSLFGDRYGDIFGDELMNALEAYGYFGGSNEKKGEISKTIYDKVTVRDAQQQNESFNKKVIKETVKKVLKERLKNN